MKHILILLALAVGIASCGVRGDPEAPPAMQQAQ